MVVRIYRPYLFHALVLASFLWLTTAAFAADIPSIADADLQQALTLAGDNHSELQAALDACQQKPYEMQAQRFVVASLPLADLGKISAAELTDNLQLALQARGEFAYGQQYDDATFAHYVLPPRVSQEPLSSWRQYMYDQLQGVVANSPTLDTAALEVNKWCGAHARFEQTQSRDQGPLATLASGYGRCEELCILLIDACRSVGIPARMAYCPWWATGDNNHAWVEIYGSDGRWHFCGGAEPAATLDKAWFGEAVKSAPIIVSPCFGLPGIDDPASDVLTQQTTVGARYCLLNSTRFYRQTGWLDLFAPNPQTDNYANVCVFNYGALRGVAKLEIKDSRAKVELGVGDYIVSSNAGGAEHQQWVHIAAGQTTERDLSAGGTPPSDVFLLQFPADPN